MEKNKKGSHVGMILSFAIFILFLTFAYSILEPVIQLQGNKEPLLNSLKSKIIQDISSEMIVTTIFVNPFGANDSCLRINQSRFEIENFADMNLIVKDRGGENVDSDKEPIFLDINREGKTFFKIYYANESLTLLSFDDASCDIVGEGDYSVASVRTSKYIFETKINELLSKYDSSYATLRNELEIPTGNNFGIAFTFSNGEKKGLEEVNASTSIYAERLSVQYINEEANINTGFLDIKIW